jgi:hypothetical protein
MQPCLCFRWRMTDRKSRDFPPSAVSIILYFDLTQNFSLKTSFFGLSLFYSISLYQEKKNIYINTFYEDSFCKNVAVSSTVKTTKIVLALSVTSRNFLHLLKKNFTLWKYSKYIHIEYILWKSCNEFICHKNTVCADSL